METSRHNTKKVFAFIDGSNLFGGMAEILKPGEYFEFADFINEVEKQFPLQRIYFYGTYMRHLAGDSAAKQKLSLSQRKFFDSAKKNPKVIFYQGHFSKTTGKEKGIDVHLGIDMAVGAATGSYEEAVIITGDADLLYAVETAQRFQKSVHLVSLSSRFPPAIALKTRRTLIFDLNNHFEKKILPTRSFLAKRVSVTHLDIPIQSINKPGTKGAGHVKKW